MKIISDILNNLESKDPPKNDLPDNGLDQGRIFNNTQSSHQNSLVPVSIFDINNGKNIKEHMSTISGLKCPDSHPYPLGLGSNVPESLRNVCYNNKNYARNKSGPCGSWCVIGDESKINESIADGNPFKDPGGQSMCTQQYRKPEGVCKSYPSNYVGCFKDSWGRDLPEFVGNMSQEECGNEAKRRNMKYYGLQDQGGIGGRRGQCFLGNIYGRYGHANNCKVIDNIPYGQAWSNAIYNNESIKYPSNYKGCFRDSGNRDLPTYVGRMSPEQCKNEARRRNIHYYGLQNHGNASGDNAECWLGDSYGKYGWAENCINKGNQALGMAWSNAVHENDSFRNDKKYPSNYKGCYKDAWVRDLPEYVGVMNEEQCGDEAKKRNKRYYGLQDHGGWWWTTLGQCFLGDSYGRYGTGPIEKNEPYYNCRPLGNVPYGMGWANAVYEVSESEELDYEEKIKRDNEAKISDLNKEIDDLNVNSGMLKKDEVKISTVKDFNNNVEKHYVFDNNNKQQCPYNFPYAFDSGLKCCSDDLTGDNTKCEKGTVFDCESGSCITHPAILKDDEITSNFNKNKLKLVSQLNNVENELRKDEGVYKYNNSKKHKLQNVVEKKQKTIDSLNSKLNHYKSLHNDEEGTINKLTHEKTQLNNIINKTEDKIKSTDKLIDNALTHERDYKKEINNLNNKLTELKKEDNSMQQKISKMDDSIINLKDEIKNTKHKYEDQVFKNEILKKGLTESKISNKEIRPIVVKGINTHLNAKDVIKKSRDLHSDNVGAHSNNNLFEKKEGFENFSNLNIKNMSQLNNYSTFNPQRETLDNINNKAKNDPLYIEYKKTINSLSNNMKSSYEVFSKKSIDNLNKSGAVCPDEYPYSYDANNKLGSRCCKEEINPNHPDTCMKKNGEGADSIPCNDPPCGNNISKGVEKNVKADYIILKDLSEKIKNKVDSLSSEDENIKKLWDESYLDVLNKIKEYQRYMDTTYFEGSPDNWQEYKNYTLENVDGKQYDQNLKLTSNFYHYMLWIFITLTLLSLTIHFMTVKHYRPANVVVSIILLISIYIFIKYAYSYYKKSHFVLR